MCEEEINMKKLNMKNIAAAAAICLSISVLAACGNSGKEEVLWEETTIEDTEETTNDTAEETTNEPVSSEVTKEVEPSGDNLQKTVDILCNNKDTWLAELDPLSPVSYRLYDFNADGNYEIVVAQNAGTGIFSTNFIYTVNAESGEIKRLEQLYLDQKDMEGGTSEVDFNYGPYLNNAITQNGINYYEAADFTKSGTSESSATRYFFNVESDRVVFTNVGTKYTYNDENGTETNTYYDDNFEEIDEASYNALYDAFTQSKSPVEYTEKWASSEFDDINAKDAAALSADLLSTIN